MSEQSLTNQNESIEKKWTAVLLSWINKCVSPVADFVELNLDCLLHIIIRYKTELYIFEDVNPQSLDDVEGILEKKYCGLQRRNSTEPVDEYSFKKLCIATTVLLYEICMNKTTRTAVSDICKTLPKDECEMILKLLQKLKRCEITVKNIEASIKAAYIETFGSIADIEYEIKSEPMMIQRTDEEIQGDAKTENLLSQKSSSHELKTLLSPRDEDVSQKLKIQDSDSEIKVKQRVGTCGNYHNTNLALSGMDVSKPSSNLSSGSTPLTQYWSRWERDTDLTPSEDITKGSNYSLANAGGIRWHLYLAFACMVLTAVAIVFLCSIPLWNTGEKRNANKARNIVQPSRQLKRIVREELPYVTMQWQCKNNFCVQVHGSTNITMHRSLSRCTLLCVGPQLWPQPIGYMQFSKDIAALSTTNLEYKFQSVPSEMVQNYLAEAFKLFLKNVLKLDISDRIKSKNQTEVIDLPVKKISIEIEVENDPNPRLTLNTDESYVIKINTGNSRVLIRVISASFCGVRHGLETTSQLILLDQVTGYLVTLTEITIKDGPSHKYRGLMLDTGRNFIPVPDIIRTIDGMASCKLNTFHWKISSETSFPLHLTKLPYLAEYGAYDTSMIYTEYDVKYVVWTAGIRGIRVLVEVTAPGPVGRPWSWFSQATCPRKSDNYTCENVLCMRLIMDTSVFDILQILYREIIEMTGVNDVFHLSDGMFSMINCYQMISARDGFLTNALERLKLANKGIQPQLPIIWYTPHLMKDSEAKVWERLGVQLTDWDPNPGDQDLGKFRVIHSINWDLSCKIIKHRCFKYRTWQDMYAWKSWQNMETFSVEGGETILWSDLVNSGNIDNLLWPRAAAVAERLWSGQIANSTANKYVYLRLDRQRWRMILRGIKAQPIWPAWCSFNPSTCLDKIRN